MSLEDDRIEYEERELIIRRAVFGKEVDSFMSSPIGKYLLDRAEDEGVSALREFKTCDPHDATNVQKLQNIILRSENLTQWLQDAVQDGLQALQIIEDRGML